MNENVEINNSLITKWLRVMMFTAAVSLINSLISILSFIPESVTTWISRGIMVVKVLSVFQLVSVNARYKKAGIYRAVMLGCTIVTELLHTGVVLTLAASILSIMAVYQEYKAHSELIAEKNHRLSGKWNSLFMWSILSSVLVGFASTAAVLIIVMMEIDAAKAATVIAVCLSIPQYIIEVVYIFYLRKMIALFTEA